MAEYRLHCVGESGNCYKAALMLQLSGCDWEPVAVDYFGGETRSERYRREVNEMGEVPVLEHRGAKLTQSGVILDYLAGETGQFGARSEEERREILRWLLFDNHKLTSYTATYRFMRTFVREPDPAVVAEFGKRAKTAWGILESHLKGRSYVVADRLTIADLSMCGYLFWHDEIGVDWTSDYPAIAGWLRHIRSHPRWVAPYDLMPGHPLPAERRIA